MKNHEKDLFNDDLNISENNLSEKDFSSDLEWKPQDMSFDTFKLRNDPSHLLQEIKYYLMQVEEVPSKDNPNKIVLARTKNPFSNVLVDPIVNQQGVQEIMMVLQPLINNHNVMGNTSTENYHKERMYSISTDFSVVFWSKRDQWNLKRDNVNPLIYFLSHQIDIFLSRTIGDAERMHYGESFKESREVRPAVQEKKNFLSNFVGGFKR